MQWYLMYVMLSYWNALCIIKKFHIVYQQTLKESNCRMTKAGFELKVHEYSCKMLLILTSSLLVRSMSKADDRERITRLLYAYCTISNLPHINSKCAFWWPERSHVLIIHYILACESLYW